MNYKKFFIGYMIVVILAIFGELRCIYQFINSDFEPSYKREVIYGVGVFTGFGVIIGYLNVPDVPSKD